MFRCLFDKSREKKFAALSSSFLDFITAIFTQSLNPREGLGKNRANELLSFPSYFKTLIPATEIETATSSFAVMCTSDCISSTAVHVETLRFSPEAKYK